MMNLNYRRSLSSLVCFFPLEDNHYIVILRTPVPSVPYYCSLLSYLRSILYRQTSLVTL